MPTDTPPHGQNNNNTGRPIAAAEAFFVARQDWP